MVQPTNKETSLEASTWTNMDRVAIHRRSFTKTTNKLIEQSINFCRSISKPTSNNNRTDLSACNLIINWCETALHLCHHVKNSPLLPSIKQIIFLHGLATLTVIFHTQKPTEFMQLWKNRFSSLNIYPDNYSWWTFSHSHVVYIKISTTSKHTYIVMTTVTIASRDKSRKRKLKQAQNDRFAQCEPAIRFWKRTGTMHKYASIVIEKSHPKH
jgi:hypothetical protein